MPRCGKYIHWIVLVSRGHDEENERGGRAVGDRTLSAFPVQPLLWLYPETLGKARLNSSLTLVTLPIHRYAGENLLQGHSEQLKTVLGEGPPPHARCQGLCSLLEIEGPAQTVSGSCEGERGRRCPAFTGCARKWREESLREGVVCRAFIMEGLRSSPSLFPPLPLDLPLPHPPNHTWNGLSRA